MAFIFWLLFFLYLASSGVLILVVLIQSGKGGGLSGLVGAGTTLGDTLGASGVEKTLNRWTTYCAAGFLVINILLVIMGPHIYQQSILDKVPLEATTGAPVGTGDMPGVAPEAATPVEGPIAPAATNGEVPAAPASEAPVAGPQTEVPLSAPAEGAAAVPAAPVAPVAPAAVPAEPAPAPAPVPDGN